MGDGVFIHDIEELQSLGSSTMPAVAKDMDEASTQLKGAVVPESDFPDLGFGFPAGWAAEYEQARLAVEGALLQSAKHIRSCGEAVTAIAQHWMSIEQGLAGSGGS